LLASLAPQGLPRGACLRLHAQTRDLKDMNRLGPVADLLEQHGGSRGVYEAAIGGRVTDSVLQEVTRAAADAAAALDGEPPLDGDPPVLLTPRAPLRRLPSYLERAGSSTMTAGGCAAVPGAHAALAESVGPDGSNRPAAAAVAAQNWSPGTAVCVQGAAAGGKPPHLSRKGGVRSQFEMRAKAAVALRLLPVSAVSAVQPKQQQPRRWQEPLADFFLLHKGSGTPPFRPPRVPPPLSCPPPAPASSLAQQPNGGVAAGALLPLTPQAQLTPGPAIANSRLAGFESSVMRSGGGFILPLTPSPLPPRPPFAVGTPLQRLAASAAAAAAGQSRAQLQPVSRLDACTLLPPLQRTLSRAGSLPATLAPLEAAAAPCAAPTPGAPAQVASQQQQQRKRFKQAGVSDTSRRIVEEALQLEQRLAWQVQAARQLAPHLAARLPLAAGLQAGGAAATCVCLQAAPGSCLVWRYSFLRCPIDACVGNIVQVGGSTAACMSGCVFCNGAGAKGWCKGLFLS
jgi:hypothetical protein